MRSAPLKLFVAIATARARLAGRAFAIFAAFTIRTLAMRIIAAAVLNHAEFYVFFHLTFPPFMWYTYIIIAINYKNKYAL